MTADPVLEPGIVAPELAAEFPELDVRSCVVRAPARGADPGVAERLRLLAGRFRGARAIQLRREPVPAAYRVFYRHVGLDPDATRTPVEEAALDRLLEGGHHSRGRLDDALLLALLETGVPVNALDADRLTGPPTLRPALAGERLGDTLLAPGRIVIADAERPVAALFAALAPDVVPGRVTVRLRLVAVRVPGVPDIHVDEAIWICCEALAGP